MNALIGLFLDVCLLRKGPADVPASKTLLKLTIGLYMVIGLVSWSIGRDNLLQSLPVSFLLAVFEMLLIITFVNIVLNVAGFPERILQTVTAMIGTGVMITVVAIPLLIWHYSIDPEYRNASAPSLLSLGLQIWLLAIYSRILADSVNQPSWVGTILSVVYIFSSWTFTQWLITALIKS